MAAEINMSLVLILLVTFLLMIGLIIWRRSGSWLKNLTFTALSIAIIVSWILIIYVVVHFGPALAK